MTAPVAQANCYALTSACLAANDDRRISASAHRKSFAAPPSAPHKTLSVPPGARSVSLPSHACVPVLFPCVAVRSALPFLPDRGESFYRTLAVGLQTSSRPAPALRSASACHAALPDVVRASFPYARGSCASFRHALHIHSRSRQ